MANPPLLLIRLFPWRSIAKGINAVFSLDFSLFRAADPSLGWDTGGKALLSVIPDPGLFELQPESVGRLP